MNEFKRGRTSTPGEPLSGRRVGAATVEEKRNRVIVFWDANGIIFMHIYAVAMAKLHALKFELLPYLPYSPDLVPSYFSCFQT